MARQSSYDEDDGFSGGGGPRLVMRSAFPAPTRMVKRLMIVQVAIFLVSFAAYLASTPVYERIVDLFGLDPQAWRESAPLVPLWQLATYGLLHSAVDPMHIVMNMITLYFFGLMLESELGPRRFLITYFAAQLAGGACFLALALSTGGTRPVIGASGACFGVMIAAATLWPARRVILYFLPLSLRTLALIFVGIELFSFLLGLKHGLDDGVSHVTHLGGIAYGFLAARTGLVLWDPVRRLAEVRATRAVRSAEHDEQRMDALLEKIHREGMGSLSRSEREFLKRVSSRR